MKTEIVAKAICYALQDCAENWILYIEAADAAINAIEN